MYTFEDIGQAGTHQKIIPGNTATGFDKNCYQYREFFLLLNGVDAGSIEPTGGQWVVGQTSGARAIVVGPTLTAGAYGASSARVTLRVRSMSGTFAATENIGIVANLDAFTVRTATVAIPCPSGYDYEGLTARAVTIEILDNVALVSFCGETPDQTSLIGLSFTPFTQYVVKDPNVIRLMKFIDKVASSASTIQAVFHF